MIELDVKEDARSFFGTLLMTLVFAAYYLPAGYAISANAYNIWRAAIIAVSAIGFIVYLAKCRISLRWAILSLFLLAYYLLSTAINQSDGNSFQVFFNIVKVGGFITWLEYGLSNDKDMCLKSFLIAGVIVCAIHYGTFLMYHDLPYGMRQSTYASVGEISRQHWFFLTHDNGSAFYFLPLLTCAWYYSACKDRMYWLPAILSALTLFMYWSLWTVTAMVSFTFAVVLYILIWKTDCTRLRSIITYRRALAVGASFCVIVLLFFSSDLMSFIAGYFGKADDLGRGRIWTRAIPLFAQTPLFGVGLESDFSTTLKLGINHCHNIIVQVLYTGGITAFILGVLGLLLCQSKEERGNGMITKPQCILCASIIAFFIVATFDWYLYMPMQFLPFILYAYSAGNEKSAGAFHDGAIDISIRSSGTTGRQQRNANQAKQWREL